MTALFNKKWKGLSRRGSFLVALLLAAGLCRAPEARAQAMSGTYKVCPTCTYTTVSAAVADLKKNGLNGPVTINIAAGTYKENVAMDTIPGLSSTNTLTFQGAGASSTRITGTGGANGGVVQVRNLSYINFKGLTIQNTSSSSAKQALELYYANYCTVDSCALLAPTFPSGSNYALYNYYCIGNTFTNNYIHGGYDVIYNYGQSGNSTYGYHTFRNNLITGTYYHTFYTYYVAGCVYDRNIIDSAVTTVTYGVYSNYESGATYSNNTIPGYSFTSAGMYFNYPNYYDQSKTFQVYNNIVGPFPSTNSVTYGVYYYSSKAATANFKFLHNTVAMSNTDGTNFYMGTNSTTGGITIANNIFSRSTTGVLARFNSLKSGDVLAYNDYSSATSTGVVYYNGTTYNSVADFVAAAKPLGHAVGAQTIKPAYKSATNLHIDASGRAPWGKDMGIAKDIDGDARCKTFPTAGADESTVTIKPGFIGPDTVYVNSPAIFTNTGNIYKQNFEWYLDGTKISDSTHLKLLTSSTGTLPLRLVSINCNGRDSITKNVIVVNPSSVPKAAFIASANLIKTGGIVKLTDLSTNGPTQWSWKISPDSVSVNGVKTATYTYVSGNASAQNPVIQFNQGGKYDICLTATNGVGASAPNCHNRYVIVSPSYNMGGAITTVTDSTGDLYDDGGPNGQYSSNFNGHILIAPCASKVYLVIKDFDMECGYDYLRIYDGENNHGTPLHPCTTNSSGTLGPGFTGYNGSSCTRMCLPSSSDTFVAKSGKMYIEMTSDGSGVGNGFSAHWWRTPRVGAKPKAHFDVSSDSVCVNSYVTFFNTSTGDDLKYDWDLDGDPSYYECSGKCDTNTWAYLYAGDYTITLIAHNSCGLSDTFSRVIHVFNPPTPVTRFEADNLTPAQNEVVFFTPTVKECVDAYHWTIKSDNGGQYTFVNGTSAFSPYPQVSFQDTGCYSIQLYVENATAKDSLMKSCYIHVKNAYCTPTVSNLNEDIGISRVVLNTLDNTSASGDAAYTDYRATVSTNLEIGVSYKLSVYRSSNNNPMTRTVWIDWNGDGDFDDTGEKVAEEKNALTLSWTTSFSVPPYAHTGATVMRVGVSYGNFANKSCGGNQYGEFEDYRIYITHDKSKPEITLLGADTIQVEQGYAFTDPGATASDNIDGNLTYKIHVDKLDINDTTQAFDPLVAGTYRFTYTVSDLAGNEADPVSRIVIITKDKTKPDLIVTGPDTIIVPLNGSYQTPAVISANDLLDGDLKADVQVVDSVNTQVVDTFRVHYFVSDANGNRADVYRTVIVVDTTAPEIHLVGAAIVYMQVGTAYTDSGANVSDNYYDNATLRKNLKVKTDLDVAHLGTYTYTYTLTDPSGNKAVSQVRTIIVKDTIKPMLKMLGDSDIVLQVFDKFNDPGIQYSDNYNKALTVDTLGNYYSSFPDGVAAMLGKYNIVYKITDSSGNTTSMMRIITVVDTKAPVISLKGNEDTVLCRWQDYTDPGYTVTDNYYTAAQLTIDTSGTFRNTLKEGYFTIVYKATDPSGNVSNTVKRTVYIQSPEACGSGINNQQALNKSLRIYPNPSNGTFKVALIGAAANTQMTVRLTNMLGQVIDQAQVRFLSGSELSVDMSTQPAGVYLVTVTTGNTSVTRQIILSK